MAYFYNGVKLPELPSDVLADYPYCWIRKNDNTEHYDLVFTKIPGYYDATAGGIVYGANEGTAEIVHYRVPYASADSAENWDNYQTTNTWMALDANRTIMWSNHYIPNGSLTATEMYFNGSEAIPDEGVYQIQKDTLVGFADQVRRLCNTEDTMTPAQMESNLGGLNIELMEAYVTSTEEEQTIVPDEGYYGFSKITVGAVDLSSGGSGSGGTGEEYPDAETTTFGCEYASGVEFTGKVTYGTFGPVEKCPGDDLDGYPYMYLTRSNYDGSWQLCYLKKPLLHTTFQDQDRVRVSEDCANQSYQWYSGDQYWYTFSPGNLTTGNLLYTPVWSNHTIVDETTGEVFMTGSAPIRETTEAVVEVPLEREAMYTISGSTLNAIGTVVQKITGCAAQTPSGMASTLQAHFNTSEETTE